MTSEQAALAHLQAENARLHQRIAELEQPTAAPASDITAPAAWRSWGLLQAVLDTLPDPIFVKDLQHRWIACNQAFCALMGHPYEAVIGYSDPDRFPAEQARVFWEKDAEVFERNQPVFNEEVATGADGVPRPIWTRKFPLRNSQQAVIGLCGIITDISELAARRAHIEELEQTVQAERLVLQAQIIAAQSQALRDLSIPLLPIAQQAVLLPLVGSIDAERAGHILERLLEGVATYQATILIIDMTGVEVAATPVAHALVQAVQAARLLGARVIMTGVGPQLAQNLVNLGSDLGHIDTRSSLQAGIAEAFRLTAA